METVHVRQEFNMPLAQLFNHLSVHENLNALFSPIQCRLHQNGASTPYGLGSVRQLSLPFTRLGGFQETITTYQTNQRIDYKITQGSPLKNHHGVMRFSGKGSKSTLDYTIVFEGKLPLVAKLVRFALQRSVSKGLAELARQGI